MDSTISLSKGCFAFKKAEKKRNTVSGDVTGKIWYKKFDSVRKLSLDKQNDFYNSVHQPFFEEVVQFVRTSGECVADGGGDKVPAAMVHTGMALADCLQIYSILTSKLREEVTPYVAVLKGKECPSLKVAVETLVQQFTSVFPSKPKATRKKRKSKKFEIASDSSESESSGDEAVLVKSFKKSNLNFPSMINWYNTSIENAASESKCSSSASRKPLVIFISDVEGFAPSVLQDLIYITKNYLGTLPFVLLFSITSSPSLLTRYISEHSLANLSYKFIESPSTSNILSKLVREVIISRESTFMVSGKILNIFMNTFNFLDNSLSGFMRRYQFCLMEHYYANPLKSLCCPLDEVKNVVKDLPSSSLEELRQLSSMRLYVEKCSPKERAPILLDDNHLKKVLPKLMADLHARMWEFHTGVQVLNVLSRSLPSSPFGCELHDTYIKATTKNIFSADFEEALKLLFLLSKEEFLKVLSNVHNIFEDSIKSCPGSGSIIEESVVKIKLDLDRLAGKDQENTISNASVQGSPRKKSGRVLQDSPSLKNGNIIGLSDVKVLVADCIKTSSDVLNHSPRSPRKKLAESQLNGLHESPTKRARPLRNDSPSSSPSKRANGVRSAPESPRKKTPKIPKDGMIKDNSSVEKEPAKDSLDITAGKMDRAQLREKLLMMSKQIKEKAAREDAKWESIKGSVLDSLKRALVLSLGDGPRPFITFPLYELFVFESVATVRSHLIPPSPQAALHSILINPQQYLECECCQLPEISSIIPSLPDVSIAYKLHLECGRMINLYDWLQAFSTIVNSDADDGKEVQVDVNMQARFMQSVAELQFMGFIKATKRKADHVVRLTWGGLA